MTNEEKIKLLLEIYHEEVDKLILVTPHGDHEMTGQSWEEALAESEKEHNLDYKIQEMRVQNLRTLLENYGYVFKPWTVTGEVGLAIINQKAIDCIEVS